MFERAIALICKRLMPARFALTDEGRLYRLNPDRVLYDWSGPDPRPWRTR